MWLFLNNGFFSIVENDRSGEILTVRARKKGDLERVFGVSPRDIKRLPKRDYLYRAFLDRNQVARVVQREVLNIDYGNFKDSISPQEKDRYSAYSKVWSAMYTWQGDLEPEGAWWENYRDYKYTEIHENGDDDDDFDQEGHQVLYPR